MTEIDRMILSRQVAFDRADELSLMLRESVYVDMDGGRWSVCLEPYPKTTVLEFRNGVAKLFGTITGKDGL